MKSVGNTCGTLVTIHTYDMTDFFPSEIKCRVTLLHMSCELIPRFGQGIFITSVHEL